MALRADLPESAAVGNPLDLLAGASPLNSQALSIELAASGAVDSDRRALRAATRERSRRGRGRRARSRPTEPRSPWSRSLRCPRPLSPSRGLPCFRFPEDAVRALGRAAGYGAWRATPAGCVPELDVDDARAAAIIARALSRGPGWLAPEDATELLDCYGIAQPPHELVPDAAAAASFARRQRRPIALKGVADGTRCIAAMRARWRSV